MSISDDRTPSEPQPPRWDAPPQPPAWDRPADPPQGWGPPPGYAPPASYAPGEHGTGPGGPTSTEPKAIIALVLAIGSFVVVPFVPAVVALVLAGSSRRDIDASGGRLGGSGLVTAAKVVSWVNIVLCLLGVVGFVLLFVLLGSVGFS